ncbi:MAG: adenylyl-sulfate kinase [Candidatus Colwellbacteria bacterium]|nr:adenylyl-sulfate kinase [Candidatus Colwellbacteria bacterium]
MIIWFTGMSGSGKSTIAERVEKKLADDGYSVHHVDGDRFRAKAGTTNQFSREAILENNYKIIDYCESIKNDYDIIVVAVISPFQETRDKAREIFVEDYKEIFIDCPIEVLIRRDTKNLYSKAKAGEISNLIGVSPNTPYERPQDPDLVIDTSKTTVAEAVEKVYNLITNV